MAIEKFRDWKPSTNITLGALALIITIISTALVLKLHA